MFFMETQGPLYMCGSMRAHPCPYPIPARALQPGHCGFTLQTKKKSSPVQDTSLEDFWAYSVLSCSQFGFTVASSHTSIGQPSSPLSF